VEQALLGTMYELPSQKNVKRVVLDENAVTGKGTPMIIYEDDAQSGASGGREASKKLKDAAA
jgi:ATP-dependent Clp protease ATP-binding subunit ClpX